MFGQILGVAWGTSPCRLRARSPQTAGIAEAVAHAPLGRLRRATRLAATSAAVQEVVGASIRGASKHDRLGGRVARHAVVPVVHTRGHGIVHTRLPMGIDRLRLPATPADKHFCARLQGGVHPWRNAAHIVVRAPPNHLRRHAGDPLLATWRYDPRGRGLRTRVGWLRWPRCKASRVIHGCAWNLGERLTHNVVRVRLITSHGRLGVNHLRPWRDHVALHGWVYGAHACACRDPLRGEH
mmetsp:Transcript_21115/g.62430  ORF Transcript_21115/g.62430 Transcript_21115/m.62430 type:complete len:239 (+) Transcript_21115:382-1098(+)